ncbi:MAG TPA: P1 family peptidase [Thermoanaerobaculia bacterium]
MKAAATVIGLAIAVATVAFAASQPRARDLGIAPGIFEPGPLNAITDVADVRVGHVTLIEGDRIRTGVTAIVPHGGNLFQDKVAGGVFVGNAFGKLAGSTQVDELGTIETPIVLTNTLAVGTAVEAVVRHTIAQPGNEQVRSVNALVGETNDGGLNEIRALPVTGDHVRRAIDGARGGPVEEGAVGAGTGTVCYGWKGGIGTSSRLVPRGRDASAGSYTLGVIVQTNFGGHLTIDGVPVWKTIGRGEFAFAAPNSREADAMADGSCMIVIATDAPLTARDLQRLAARGVFGLARTGSSYSHGSGDFAIAFSTAADVRTKFGERTPRARTILPSEGVSALFQAALEATEEAVYNSLFQARTMTGNGRTVEALPLDRVKALLDARTAAAPR